MKMLMIKILQILLWLLYYVVITTIINSIVMGVLHIRFSLKCKPKEFVITKANRFEMQSGNQCAGFAADYLLRHCGFEKGSQQRTSRDRVDTDVEKSELAAFCSCCRL